MRVEVENNREVVKVSVAGEICEAARERGDSTEEIIGAQGKLAVLQFIYGDWRKGLAQLIDDDEQLPEDDIDINVDAQLRGREIWLVSWKDKSGKRRSMIDLLRYLARMRGDAEK